MRDHHYILPLEYLSTVNMRPSCEVIAKYVLPVFRSLIARELIKKYGLSQNEVAKRLGITQAAVSQYIGSKRGSLMASELEKIPAVKEALPGIIESISKNDDPDIVFTEFCKLCVTIRSSKELWGKIEEILETK